MIRFVFLDLDDTLLDFLKAEAVALRRALREVGLDPTEEVISLYSSINKRHWELLEEKKITRPELLIRRFEVLYDTLGLELSGEKTQSYYGKFLGEGHFFIPGAEDQLEALKGKYRLFLVSNGNIPVQNGRLDSAGIRHYFENIFISEAVGVNKPDKAFFDHCFGAIEGFRPEESIIIGDSLTSDIRGGINAGIQTCWFNPAGKPGRADIVPDYEIRALGELPGLLETL